MAVIIDGTNKGIPPLVNRPNGIPLTSGNISANYTVSSGNNTISVVLVDLLANVVVTVASGRKWVEL